jgi:hypothetical protein
LRRFLNDPLPFLHFLWSSPLWRGTGPSFEEFRISFTKGWVISLIEICLLVPEKKIFKKFQCIFLLCYYSARVFPFIWTIMNPSMNDLCQVWLKLTQWYWRGSRKCKSLQTDSQTDGRRTKGDQ